MKFPQRDCDLLGLWLGRVSPVAALLELYRVHRIEQARLLREASLLSSAGTELGRLYLVARRPGKHSQGPDTGSEPTWHEVCREELATAIADGASVHPRLRTLLALNPAHWPLGVLLARESLGLERSHAGLLVLAAALICEGRPRQAIAVLRALLEEDPLEDVRGAAIEGLALAFEAVGDLQESLGWWEAALQERRSDPSAAVGLLCLALWSADIRRTDIAADRLRVVDLSIPGVRNRFRRALRAACGRLRGRGERRSPRGDRRQLIRWLATEESGAAAEVARALQ